MRKSKERKRAKVLKAKEVLKVNKSKKEKKKETKEKLELWSSMPEDQWSDARKARGALANES